ncbi:NADH-quinone oxidoreductase subunit NuoH [Auraticoccus sp. F435]|uniref:NADH-quinone oxidoreductase subunit H n=1 Tax=Auraticoccus cholistanensis TaxID=2656650 RepID=A0A6A9US58_9ACTN|nr:NADH-quinone oxidoreductase subunit NuoH [Auraticoccus cholistanensis]MVA75531.1 NADH-quinone oxidoreductase subunit NuoH [Auraticoccus cholistanensis]
MTPLDLSLFGADPWWVVLLKGLFVFVLLLLLTLFNIVFERKVVGRMQHRKGPTMNGPFGWLQSLADGMKLMFKEDFMPAGADRLVFNLAPFLSAVPALTAWAVIPIAGPVTVPFTDRQTNLQLTDLPMAVLFLLAIASIGIYGIVLAGWSSGSTYSLLGGLRSSAQMISYEIAMGLSLVAVFLKAQSMATSEIVEAQQQTMQVLGTDTGIPGWYALLLLPSFVIYLISMVGETNRAPFDLPEAEGELVGGFHTEYSGMRFAMFFLAEYINMATVSAIAVTLFLGGWHAPWPLSGIEGIDAGYLGAVWFLAKVVLLIFVFVWLRGTLPRFRYDQFMKLGWKWLIPLSLGWTMAVAVLERAQAAGWFSNRAFLLAAGLLLVLAFALILFGGREPEPATEEDSTDFDPFAGGYPVPPQRGQQLPEMAGVLRPEEPPRPGTRTGEEERS